jgi:hypothetical protein
MNNNNLQNVLYNSNLLKEMENFNINDECRLCKKLRQKMSKKHNLFFGKKFKCSNI